MARGRCYQETHQQPRLLPILYQSVPVVCWSCRAGAVWDIFQRTDSSALSGWLSQHAADFSHMGHNLAPAASALVQACGPVSSQTYMLQAAHRGLLEAETGKATPQHA
jgi:hypothetical protein